MSKRSVAALGAVAAAGAGYYLYAAGGDPEAAQKKIQADAAKAQAKVKSEIPGKEKEYEKRGEAMASQAGQKFDQAVNNTRGKLSDAQAKAEDYKQRTGKELNQAIDKFDSSVEKKTSEAKSGISSWFGGK